MAPAPPPERRPRALTEQLPGPTNLWIRYLPRAWPAQPFVWTNFATATLGMRRAVAGLPRIPLAPAGASGAPSTALDDTAWVPPLAVEREAERDGWLEQVAAHGAPLLVQLLPGQVAPAIAGTVPVYDLVEPLLRRDLGALAALPTGSLAVWPLVGGLTGTPSLIDGAMDRLATAGVAAVQAMTLELDPTARRELADRLGGDAFDGLFHAHPPAERAVAAAAHQRGMRAFIARPALPAGAPANRAIGEILALAAELWLRLGRSDARGGALYRAARLVDRSPHDLAALWRDGNLGVLSWLDPASRTLVEEWCARRSCALLDELYAAYVAPPDIQQKVLPAREESRR